MRSYRAWTFKELYANLPVHIQKQATAAYALFADNPNHPGLHFKPVSNDDPPIYSVRIGISYRAIGVKLEDDLIVWIWIGSHTAYDKFLKTL